MSMSNYCRNCGCPISDDVRFCPNCGLDLIAPQSAHQVTNRAPLQHASNLSKPKRSPKLLVSFIVILAIITAAGIFLGFSHYRNSDINGYWYGQNTVIHFNAWQRVVIDLPGKTIQGKYSFSSRSNSGTISTAYEKISFNLINGAIILPDMAPLTKDPTIELLISTQGETTTTTTSSETPVTRNGFQSLLTRHEWIYHSTVQSTPDTNIPELYDITPDSFAIYTFSDIGTITYSLFDSDTGQQLSSDSYEYEITDETAMAYLQDYELNHQLYELFYFYQINDDGFLSKQLMLHDTFTDEFSSVSSICLFEPAVQ